jgi:pyruvate-ferredoxin/flavodoxin oxidoreductase
MSVHQTGFVLLNSASVKEVHDIDIITHLAAIKARLPFLHFFDWFGTSYEIQKINILNYDTIKTLTNLDIKKFFEKA